MWRNWSLFKRKPQDNNGLSSNGSDGSGGKENMGVGGGGSDEEDGQGRSRSNVEFYVGSSRLNGSSLGLLQSGHEEGSSYGENTSRVSPRNKKEVGILDKSHLSLSIQRGVQCSSSSPFMDNQKLLDVSKDSSRNNSSLSGVYGPLLSTPIVPKVRRALERNSELRSPQTSILGRGRQIGRSPNLNYGSGSTTKSTVGQVPWVRLKRRESLTLSDILSGNTQQSPNTVKLALHEPRLLLPSAPSFKTTPVIVTTEHSRARMVDTQTVVSALREKRKRFVVSQRDDSFSEDSWINAAKRRRQDSSQSNASSVSIPSMPESLPNLMGTPGVSLLHIENLKDQRPSTVPAMDAFVSRHQREYGLGGEMLEPNPHQSAHNYQQQQFYGQDTSTKQANKSALRSIQSSLSSSLRARSNLSALQQSGPVLNRIHQLSESHNLQRTRPIFSDASLTDISVEEPDTNVSRLTTADTLILPVAPSTRETPHPVVSPDNNSGLVSSQTKQKIADGVVLRKQSMSLNSFNSLSRPSKMLSLNTLASTNDFELDKQKEYKRKVLDLLDIEEAPDGPAIVTPMTTSIAVATIAAGSTSSIASSQAATSAAVSASLDSLNKLVHSATAAMPSSISTSLSTSANTLIKSADSKISSQEQTTKSGDLDTSSVTFTGLSTGSSSMPLTTQKEVSFGAFITTVPSTQSTNTAPSTAASGFTFGLSQTPPTAPTTQTTKTSTTTSVTVNTDLSMSAFSSSHQNITPLSNNSTALGALSGKSQENIGLGFSYNSGTTSGLNQSTNQLGFLAAGSGFEFGRHAVTSATSEGTKNNQLGSVTQSTGNSAQTISTSSFNNQVGNALQSSNNSLQTQSIPSSSGSISSPQGVSNIFNSGRLQELAPSSDTFSLSSTLQAFDKAQGINSPQGQTNIFSSTPHTMAATTASISIAGGFNFVSTNTSSSLPSGFNFGSIGGTTLPVSNSTSTTFSSSNSSSANLGFNFGAMTTAATTVSQLPGNMSFGTVATNSIGPSSNPTFKGFGANTQTTASTAAFPTTGLAAQNMFQSSALIEPMSAQSPISTQQPFGQTSTPAAFSFAASITSNNFAFAQGSVANATSKPFSFGAVATQSGGINSFVGAMGNAAVTSSSVHLGSVVSPSSDSVFGSGVLSALSSSTAPPQFGSAVPTTSPPAFGSNNLVSVFGASTQQGAPSMFGAPTATQQGAPSMFGAPTSTQQGAPSIFGAPTSTQLGALSMFGAPTSTQQGAPSMFGAPTSTQQGAPSMFGAPTSSSNLLFTFGAASGNKQQSAQPPTFASNTGAAFGSNTTPGFGSNATSCFGSNATSGFGSNPVAAFGSHQSNFGSATAQAFGATKSSNTFGTNASTAFGTNPSATAFASNTSSTFGSNPTSAFAANPSSIFGSNSGSFGMSASTTSMGTSGTNTFGSNPVTSFGNGAAAVGSSFFGAKSTAPTFGAGTSNSITVFGALSQPVTTASPFGPSFGMSTTFGVQQNTDKSAFGSPVTGFGTATMPSFGSTSQSTAFGAAQQNPTQNMFGPNSQTQTPAFGSQQTSLQTTNSGSFGANFFPASKPNNMFGAVTTANSNFNSNQQNMFTSQAPSSGFNFGQTSTQPATTLNMGLGFGSQTPGRPSFQAPSNGFNFAAAAGSTPTFNFSGTPSTPNPFSQETPTSVPRPRAVVRRPARRGGSRR